MMKIWIEGKEYFIETEGSMLAENILECLPAVMDMRRNGSNEFIAELPVKPVNDGRHVSRVRPDEVYYYEGWNVLCLNYAEADISPYYVSYVGSVRDGSFSEVLKNAGNNLEVRIER